MGDRYLLSVSMKFSSDSSFVNIKKGNNAGAIDVAHTNKPFIQASRFFSGLDTNNIINVSTINDKNIVFLFDKFKFFAPFFCLVIIISINL